MAEMHHEDRYENSEENITDKNIHDNISRARKLLIRAEKARKQFLQPRLSLIGLTFGQGHARILDTLLTRDRISQRELAELCRMDVTTMSRNLDKLENSGYLVRENDPESRRTFLVCLTRKGTDEARKVRQVLDLTDQVIAKGMTSEEYETFLRCLEQVCENLEQEL